MSKKILTEAGGSMVSGYLINAINEAGFTSVASDIKSDCFGAKIADEFVVFPAANDKSLWSKIENILVDNRIDYVLPSFDEMLLGWSKRKNIFQKLGVEIMVSSESTVSTFLDKWSTYQFFERNKINCPKTSLSPQYPLIKPRIGRGSEGLKIEHNASKRNKIFSVDFISQEIIQGIEYTVDCLIDKKGDPIYIIPRKRLEVKEGKSISGVVDMNLEIINEVIGICKIAKFVGPINMQCFYNINSKAEKRVTFIEINPRIAGGMALGFKASENWVPLFIDIMNEEPIKPKEVKDGLKMLRSYSEVFYL